MIYILIIVIFYTLSCKNSPTNSIDDKNEIIIDYQSLNIELIGETDTTYIHHIFYEIVYHPVETGFQLFFYELNFSNYDSTNGLAYANARRRSGEIIPHYISANQKDTLVYDYDFINTKKDKPFTRFKYSMRGVYTDVPIYNESTDIDIHSCYTYSDTITYGK